MQTLDVVNEMLGTMGEAPLNTLEDPHAFRGACLSTLSNLSRQIQAKGWWFNREKLVLAPSALDSTIYLPGDFISVRVPRNAYGQATRNVVQRGRRLYDTEAGTFAFTSSVTVDVVRLIPFQDLPEVAAQYIASKAVLQFQSKYDGDTAKSRELKSRIEGPDGTFAAINIEETRDQQVNLIESNVRLQRLKAITKSARRLLR
jgi:hypothetical protein